jgi:hypothetical protein
VSTRGREPLAVETVLCTALSERGWRNRFLGSIMVRCGQLSHCLNAPVRACIGAEGEWLGWLEWHRAELAKLMRGWFLIFHEVKVGRLMEISTLVKKTPNRQS